MDLIKIAHSNLELGFRNRKALYGTHTSQQNLDFYLRLHSIIRLLKLFFKSTPAPTILWFVFKRAATPLCTGYFPMTKMFKHL